MRRYRTSYWLVLFYNGIVGGLWLATPIAFVLATVQHSYRTFVAAFVAGMWICIPFFMWLYHTQIWPRRARQKQGSQR